MVDETMQPVALEVHTELYDKINEVIGHYIEHADVKPINAYCTLVAVMLDQLMTTNSPEQSKALLTHMVNGMIITGGDNAETVD